MMPPSLPPLTRRRGPRPGALPGLAAQWAALHAAAQVVASLAESAAPGTAAAGAALAAAPCPPALVAPQGGRRVLLDEALGDTAAILEAGIRALLTARAAGAATGPAAQALWGEFVAARAGVLALAGAA